ncbi:hypothetical protein L598_001600000360 [Mesorhizobium sp. J18]|uniref:hypothetical protein n=1 Tax=Mesorhizobium sp. J18 TaxID=935263 RepID=UPI00119AE2DE|nr:hypothetical protein [Mesorhizobium sp. J18]TWG99072.1 hypothetical protein L598_001600000360 [Mesorhizobium sp. J18]
MDDTVQKSCWGVTAKAVVGFATIILMAWLFSGAETKVSDAEPAAVLATAN